MSFSIYIFLHICLSPYMYITLRYNFPSCIIQSYHIISHHIKYDQYESGKPNDFLVLILTLVITLVLIVIKVLVV